MAPVNRRPPSTVRSAVGLAVAASLAFGGLARPCAAYQLYGVRLNGQVVTLKWKQPPVRYYVTDMGVSGVSAADLKGAIDRAFSSWQQVPNVTLSSQFAGYTQAPPFEDDGMSTLGFASRPDLERVLGATDFLIDKVTGEIVESDIFFNSAFAWSVAAGGESGKYDLESIALHEIGHLLGLGHSALGETELGAGGGRRVIAAESVMFPIAFSAGSTAERKPYADDEAGLTELYPADGANERLGSIVGKVTRDGKGVFGAHIVAFNLQTAKLVGGFTVDKEGRFSIGSLEPGAYVLRIEPLDDADLDSFFDEPGDVDLNFSVTSYSRIAVAPRGGASASVEIPVKTVTKATTIAPGAAPVRDPTIVEFTISPDHSGRLSDGRPIVDRYVLEIYLRGGAEPLRTAEIGRPTATAEGRVVLALSSVVQSWPLPAGTYEARVTAIGPGGIGRSEASNAFSFGQVLDRERGDVKKEKTSPFASLVGTTRAGQFSPVRASFQAPRRPPAQPPRKPAAPVKPRAKYAGERAGRFGVAGSIVWLGGSSAGSASATLTPNRSGGSRYTLFDTGVRLDPAVGLEGRLLYTLTRTIVVEGGVTYSRPPVTLSYSGDVEGAPDTDSVAERMHQYYFDASVRWSLAGLAFAGARAAPYVEGGGGYLRQLHEGNTLVETGQVLHGGGGITYRLASRTKGLVKGVTLRIGARVYVRSGGFRIDNAAKVFPAANAGLGVVF